MKKIIDVICFVVGPVIGVFAWLGGGELSDGQALMIAIAVGCVSFGVLRLFWERRQS